MEIGEVSYFGVENGRVVASGSLVDMQVFRMGAFGVEHVLRREVWAQAAVIGTGEYVTREAIPPGETEEEIMSALVAEAVRGNIHG